MPNLVGTLLNLYIPLIGWVAFGWGLGRILPKSTSVRLGKVLFWVGVPISIVAFLRRADLTGWILIAPITAWIAMLVGALFAWVWIDLGLGDERIRSLTRNLDQGISQTVNLRSTAHSTSHSILHSEEWSQSTQGSFLLAMMVGNTGYMGFPVVLNLVGPEYFAWALFYDLLGTFIGVYGVGVLIASRFGPIGKRHIHFLSKLLRNPALWSLGAGLLMRSLPFPNFLQQGLQVCAWTVVNLALVLIGMQLNQLSSLRKLKQALPCLGIKMLLVPLVVGTGLMFFGVTGKPQLTLVLQMGMPPAFATVVFAEAYGLDKELAVTTIAFGCIGLLLLLPVWTLLFGSLS